MRLGIATGVIGLSGLGLTACGPTPQVLALVGSDTTAPVMGAVATSFNDNTTPDIAVNVPPVLASGNTFDVPGDDKCGSFSYHTPGTLPPNGSGAGINALVADGTNGCIDIARSSRGRSGTDPSNLDFYAFAKDAVDWSRYGSACPGGDAGPAGCAPTNLTQNQLKGIYLCDQPGGVPLFTNWSQVGGDNETIVRYLPQTGSGTLSFFETRLLGMSSAQQGVLDDSSCAVHPKRIEENSGNQVLLGDRAAAINPYSFANWTAQSNGIPSDIRGGALLGNLGGIAPSATSINNGTFIGRRWVYNVLKQTSPSIAAELKFVGVTSSASGYLCVDGGAAQLIISQYGFVNNPLGPAGSGLPNSRCRKNPTPL
jgi:phosphate transport system substrate-binding protein